MDSFSASSFTISQEEFFWFHKIDRDLYRILVNHLFREPDECMQILGVWLWLERVGFRNMVKKILSLPNTLINDVADETLLCLSCINSGLITPSSSDGNEIPLLQNLMSKEIPFQFFYENRVKALQGVAKAVQDVCVRAFTDIAQQALIRNSTERMVEPQQKVVTSQSLERESLWFGSIGPSNVRLGSVIQNNEVEAYDRTLFVTFSKGYRMEEWEVREFFTMTYGDCIESLHMQEIMQPNEQPLFARIVFHKTCNVDMILKGATKIKFTINGKHVWARKFMSKRTTSTGNLSSSLPNLPSSSGI
ncbi:hypothetical protein SESBI_11681 [Sesbania bispinosa]|nr:hypothetical protein SESBI_11681 [Sesbania bispinosa]